MLYLNLKSFVKIKNNIMKEEEKLLLLEDISARLPFGLAFIINKE